MILMKIYIDIPEGAQDFYPDEYMPSDMIRFSCSDITNVDKFLDNVIEYLKGEAHERTKAREKKERQEDLQKSSRFHKKNKH